MVQKRIYKDYEDDITKYVEGLDSAKVKRVYRHISAQLAKDNHKFQISKIGHGARTRDYAGTEEWLKDAGIINVACNLEELKLPFSSYEMSDYFRIYYSDHSLFIANLDEEAKDDPTLYTYVIFGAVILVFNLIALVIIRKNKKHGHAKFSHTFNSL